MEQGKVHNCARYPKCGRCSIRSFIPLSDRIYRCFNVGRGLQKVSVDSLNVAILDDDQANVLFSSSKINVTEGSVDSAYSIVLSSEPTSEVVVAIDPFDGYCVEQDRTRILGTVCNAFSDCGFTAVCEFGLLIETDVSEVKFGPGDWNVPKIVVVHAIDDDVAESEVDVRTQIMHTTVSADSNYNSLLRKLPVYVGDNDNEKFVTTKARRLGVSDMVYTVRLSSMPFRQDVSVDVFNGSPNKLTFTEFNWDVPQEVIVAFADGSKRKTVVHSSKYASEEIEVSLGSGDRRQMDDITVDVDLSSKIMRIPRARRRPTLWH